MKRKYVYIVAILLGFVYVISEYYVNLSIDNTVNLDEFEGQRYLNTSDIDMMLNKNFNDNIIASETYNNLTITNIQNDSGKLVYNYKLTVDGVTGAFRYTYNGEDKYLVFNAKGETDLTLYSNENIVIYDLPTGSNFKIEQSGGNSDKYTIKANNVVGSKYSGSIDKDVVVTFENKVAVKDGNKNPGNPYTADIYTLGIGLFIVTLVVFVMLRLIKIKRFE